MDNKQAKFLLASFRPDGADAHLAEFTEALQLAVEDRELGDWLARERAADAEFAAALSEISIPDGLRDEILTVLAFDGQAPSADADLESAFVGGMFSITPPEGLRDQILAAMEQSVASEREPETHRWKWMSVAAIAASVAVAALVTLNSPESAAGDSQKVAQNEQTQPLSNIASDSVQTVAVHSAVQEMAEKLQTPANIDLKTGLGCTHDAQAFLDTKAHPVPEHLPIGLESARLVGARDMYLDSGQPVSLLCFEKEGMGMVHLIVLDIANVKDPEKLESMKSISLKSCYGCSLTQFNIAHWRDGDKAYMVLTKAAKEDVVKLF